MKDKISEIIASELKKKTEWKMEDWSGSGRGSHDVYTTTLFDGLIEVQITYVSIPDALSHYFKYGIYAIADDGEKLTLVNDDEEFDYGWDKLEYMKEKALTELRELLPSLLSFAAFNKKFTADAGGER